MVKCSVVVPFHNEEGNVTVLYARLKQVMEQVTDSFELVLVDDGSNDRTYRLLEEITAVDSRVLVVKLRRNFGQTSALAAGFDHASGEYILAMDGDLQHDPADIPCFIEKLDEGYDLVSGWRTTHIDSLALRRIPFRCANWMMARLSGVAIHDFGTTFKAYRREVIQNIPLYGEMHRFIPALARLYGASICEIPIRNSNHGHSKGHYGLGRAFRVLCDLMTVRFLHKYMSRPLHLFGSFGSVSVLAGCGVALGLLAVKVIHPEMAVTIEYGPMFVIGAVLIVAGIQLMAVGMLGELHVRHYFSTERPASYAVDRLVRLVPAEDQSLLSRSKEGNF
jgi:glycosyltransferase involved in cell wall biosynthesis